MPEARKLQRHRGSAGFIVVAVLWILSGFATLALIYSAYLGDSAISLSVNDDKIAAEAAISAGVELTAYRLLATGQDRPTRGCNNSLAWFSVRHEWPMIGSVEITKFLSNT